MVEALSAAHKFNLSILAGLGLLQPRAGVRLLQGCSRGHCPLVATKAKAERQNSAEAKVQVSEKKVKFGGIGSAPGQNYEIMKKTFLFIALQLSLFISCSPETSPEEDIDSVTIKDKLIKEVRFNEDHNMEFRYNEDSLLTKIIYLDLGEEVDYVETFHYDAHNNVILRELTSSISYYQSSTFYYYDGNNNLTETVASTPGTFGMEITSTSFSYSDKGITVETTSGKDDSRIITIETNSSGLISRLTEGNGYSDFDYDANGNLINISVYDEQDALVYSHTYTYDQKPNPFYGQLKSSYFSNFLIKLHPPESSINRMIFPQHGYAFPYLKNNILQFETEKNSIRTYTYDYDSDDYPTFVDGKWQEGSGLQFGFEYFGERS